jgi:hypothetical protein
LNPAFHLTEGSDGSDVILRQALNAETGAEVGFLIKSIAMLAWYHINQKPVITVITDTAIPVGVAEDDTAAMLFAVDHVYWTESIAEIAKHRESQTSNNGVREIWLLGSASDRTRKELANLGFVLRENVSAMMMAPSS